MALRGPLSRRTALALVAMIGTIVVAHDVPVEVTADDRAYATRMLTASGYPSQAEGFGNLADFDNQIRAVVAVQDAVLDATPKSEGLPLGQPREPHDVFDARQGLCFDRSRVIEKMLGHLGLETRHLSIFSTKDGRSKLAAIFGDTTKSHAVSEVRSARGWMLVDFNARWIGLDAGRQPVDAGALHSAAVAGGRVEDGRGSLGPLAIAPFPIPAHQTGRADCRHPVSDISTCETELAA